MDTIDSETMIAAPADTDTVVTETNQAGDDTRCIVALAALAVFFVLFSWPAASALGSIYRYNATYSHGFIVPLISAYVLWKRRNWSADFAAALRPMGLVLLAGGMSLVLLGLWYDVALPTLGPRHLGHAFVEGVGVMICVGGIWWGTWGAGNVRRAVGPIAFLALGLPLPGALSDMITLPLRRASATLSYVVLKVLGQSVIKHGNVLEIDGHALGVAEACSGIRSTTVLLALVCAYWLVASFRKRRALLLLVSVPVLAISGNVVRIVVSALGVHWGFPQLVKGGPHEFVGMLTFAGSAAVLIALAGVLSGAAKRDDRVAPAAEASSPRWSRDLRLPWVVTMSLMLAVGSLTAWVVSDHYAELYFQDVARDTPRLELHDFPKEIAGYQQMREQELSEEEEKALEPSDYLGATYSSLAGESVQLTLLYWLPRTVKTRFAIKPPHSPDRCFPSAGWDRVKEADVSMDPPWALGNSVYVRLFTREGDARMIAFWRYGAPIARDEWYKKGFIKGRLLALLGSWKPEGRSGVRLDNQYSVSIVTDASEGEAVARNRVLRFAEAIAPLLPEYGLGIPAEIQPDSLQMLKSPNLR